MEGSGYGTKSMPKFSNCDTTRYCSYTGTVRDLGEMGNAFGTQSNSYWDVNGAHIISLIMLHYEKQSRVK